MNPFAVYVDEDRHPDIARAMAYGDYELAQKFCIEELYKQPLNSELLLQMAFFYFKLKDFQKSAKAAEVAAKYCQGDHKAYFFIAASYGILMQHKKCLTALKKVNDLLPGNAYINRCIGSEYCNLKMFKKGFIFLKQSLAIDPKDPDTFFAFAVSCVQMGDLDQAQDWVNMALEKNPTHPDYVMLFSKIADERKESYPSSNGKEANGGEKVQEGGSGEVDR